MSSLTSTRSILIILVVLSITVIGLWTILDQRTSQSSTPDNRLIIATTIFPLTDIAKNIGGETVHIIQLLPTGASPHNHKLTPQQLSDTQKARILFNIGHQLDSQTVNAVKRSIDIPIITVDQNIQLQEFDNDSHGDHNENDENHDENNSDSTNSSYNPHYWLSVPNAQEIAKTISNTLKEIDPENQKNYENNLQQYLNKLDDLETDLQSISEQINQKKFVSIHDAWPYFSAQYNLELVGTYEPVEGRQPSINDIRNLQELIQQHNIRVFYTEPQKQSTSATRLLEDDFGLTTKILDPIGGTENRNSYINLMLENIKALSN